ncbi:MAG: pyrrolo-quinoline quinone [Hyphomicrobium sp. 32-62-53]|nr:MAG: pyrrolo-quinoline quinone [Hyphomicrobium sp. 32-62-53]
MMRGLVLSGLLSCAFAFSAAAADIDDARLKAAGSDPANWITHGRDLAATRFAPSKQITTENVKSLRPAFIYQTGTAATFQTTPLVADGIMYVSAPFSHVMAVNAATGREIWRYQHTSKAKKLCCGPANRGVALGYGKVYVATVDARLVALDQSNGKVIWDIQMADTNADATEDKAALDATDPALKGKVSGSTGVGAASAPLVIDGKVIAGITGVGYGLHLDSDRPGAPLGTVVGVAGRYGRPGFIAAFDAETGERVWQFDTTQKGWEGAFSQNTVYGVPLPRDIAAEKAAMTTYADAWKFGGGSIWHSPSVDLDLGLLYFGVGNPSPQAAGESRPGDNLYTSSLVAIDLKTAKLGWYFVHDRRDGTLLLKSDAYVPQENMFKAPTRDGVVIWPGVAGGSNWSPAAVDQLNGLAFVAAMHMPTRYQSAELLAVDGKPPVTYYTFEPAKNVPTWGTLSAIDLKTGALRWQQKTDEPLIGGTLATAGGLVFNGEGNGDFSAFDAKTGARLWTFHCGAGVNAPPISYEIAGKQYIAVAAGGSQIWGFRQGGAVVVFALPD